MKENNETTSYQQDGNLISTDAALLQQNQNIELNPMGSNNQTENKNQPVFISQEGPLPVHCIPLSDINKWGSLPHTVTCPFCHQNVTTSVEASCNMGSCCLCFWLSCIIWAIILLFMGKEIGCADATHKCPNCKNVIGVYRSC